MQQRNLRFDPDLLIVPTGSKVLFPNLDPVFHNIFSLSRTQTFDLGYYAEGKSREVVFSRPGIVQVYCHVHPEMYGVVVVTPSRWSFEARGGRHVFLRRCSARKVSGCGLAALGWAHLEEGYRAFQRWGSSEFQNPG